jgi:hypothetical protein
MVDQAEAFYQILLRIRNKGNEPAKVEQKNLSAREYQRFRPGLMSISCCCSCLAGLTNGLKVS